MSIEEGRRVQEREIGERVGKQQIKVQQLRVDVQISDTKWKHREADINLTTTIHHSNYLGEISCMVFICLSSTPTVTTIIITLTIAFAISIAYLHSWRKIHGVAPLPYITRYDGR